MKHIDTIDLTTLLELARRIRMTPAEREEQRRSFAYGNAKIENDAVTREMIDRQSDFIRACRSNEM